VRHRNHKAVAIAPRADGTKFVGEACTWCGLRRSAGKLVLAAPTCNECFEGGRKARIQAYCERLRRSGNGIRKREDP
jgi:hypothetical protein